MPTPPKPFSVLKSEKKSHRTKKELKLRQEGEEALSTGVAIKERQEVRNNPIAHKEFLRINKLLVNLEKNDSIYEPVINRYCIIQAECEEFQARREELYSLIHELKDVFDNTTENMDDEEKIPLLLEFSNEMAKLSTSMINLDKQLQTKRKMLLDIEKENVMTIASALRCIPKKEEKATNKLFEVLNGS